MSAFANPVFPRIDPTSNPAGSALNRVSPLEYAFTKNAPATPLQSTLTKLLDLKSFRFRSYKKTPGGPLCSSNGSRSAAKVETKKRGGKEACRRTAPLGGHAGWSSSQHQRGERHWRGTRRKSRRGGANLAVSTGHGTRRQDRPHLDHCRSDLPPALVIFASIVRALGMR